jgi:succinate dehydrogenase/fumarate reductase iron-sulfur protein
MSTITATVFRYDPSTDETSHYEDYEVEWHEGLTVLETLRYIHENYEPLAFDYSCRGMSCGLCAMKVNGTPVLACGRQIGKGEDVTVEPLDRFPVVRDLIVDKTPVHNRILSDSPQFMRTTPLVNPVKMSQESTLYASALQMCRGCMLCMSVCPAIEQSGFDGYAGPYVMTRLAQRYYDEREGQQGMRLAQLVDEGLFNCLECGTCTSVCPKGSIIAEDGYPFTFIDHVKYFTELKQAARDAGLEPKETDEPIRPVTDDMFTNTQRLNADLAPSK